MKTNTPEREKSPQTDPGDKPGWFVYLLQCGDGSYYAGITTDPKRRLEEHRSGLGARYTRGRKPLQLVLLETWPDRGGATGRELALKQKSHEQKRRLILSQPISEVLLSVIDPGRGADYHGQEQAEAGPKQGRSNVETRSGKDEIRQKQDPGKVQTKSKQGRSKTGKGYKQSRAESRQDGGGIEAGSRQGRGGDRPQGICNE